VDLLLRHPSRVNSEEAIPSGGEVQIVGDQNEGGLHLSIQRLEKRDDPTSGLPIEIPRRFIGKENLGPGDERPREGHPLLFTPGKLGRIMMRPIGKPHAVQEFERSIPDLPSGSRARFRGQFQGDLDILECGERGEQVEGLEDEADIPGSKPCAVFLGKTGELRLSDLDRPAGGLVESGHDPEQGGLAGSRGANNGRHLSWLDRKFHTPKYGEWSSPAQIILLYSGQLNAHPSPSVVPGSLDCISDLLELYPNAGPRGEGGRSGTPGGF
jgi:hypothetical protein